MTAAVARQSSDTAGRIENCQIGGFLGYASPTRHALIDRRLYLPNDWIEAGEHRTTASIPAAASVAIKPRIGIAMLAAARHAGFPRAWGSADSVDGRDKCLPSMRESHAKPPNPVSPKSQEGRVTPSS